MNWIKYFFIMILVSACAFRSTKDMEDNKKSKQFRMQYKNYNIMDSVSINVEFIVKIPNKYLVFTKEIDHFVARLDLSMKISNFEDDGVVKRKVWNEIIQVPFYEDTREGSLLHEKVINFVLSPGDYKVFLNIQDLDNYRSYKINNKIRVQKNEKLSEIISFVKKNNKILYLENKIPEFADTVWCRFQIDPNFFLKEYNQLTYKVLGGTQFLDSSYVNITDIDSNNMVLVPIKLSREWEGEVSLLIGYEGKYSSIDLDIISKNGTPLWSDELKELNGVMAYLLPYSKKLQLYDLDEKQQYEYIRDYWKSNDPTPDTKQNELLEEINSRFAYSNTHFSILGRGWRSDMGRIYIVYGVPQSVDRRYNYESGYSIEVWYYTSGDKFIFSNRSSFGEYKLVNDIN